MSSTVPWPLETTTRDRADKPAVLVTGAGSGIGERVARRVAARRFRIGTGRFHPEPNNPAAWWLDDDQVCKPRGFDLRKSAASSSAGVLER